MLVHCPGVRGVELASVRDSVGKMEQVGVRGGTWNTSRELKEILCRELKERIVMTSEE